jgi:hypothetical protein
MRNKKFHIKYPHICAFMGHLVYSRKCEQFELKVTAKQIYEHFSCKLTEFLLIYQIKFGQGIKTSSLYVMKRHNRIYLLLLN